MYMQLQAAVSWMALVNISLRVCVKTASHAGAKGCMHGTEGYHPLLYRIRIIKDCVGTSSVLALFFRQHYHRYIHIITFFMYLITMIQAETDLRPGARGGIRLCTWREYTSSVEQK
jgi:hypothetical protein